MYHLEFVNGLGYGGEGKGRIAAYCAGKYDVEDTMDVLLCGGVNRSCTVVREDGVRHSFRHFGSATMYGYPTYLNSDFLIEPSTFRKEREQLLTIGINPIIYVNVHCNVTLPYHILADRCYNEITDLNSSGWGIWQSNTYNRFAYDRFGMHNQPTTISNIINRDKYDSCVRYFRDKSRFFSRMHEDTQCDGCDDIIEKYYSLINKDELWEQFYEDLIYMKDNCIFVSGWNDIKELGYKNFICEFSHSLSFSMSYCTDEYYTDVDVKPSYYVNIIAALGGYDNCEVTHNYVTRWYHTRCGYDRDWYDNTMLDNPDHCLINKENLYDNPSYLYDDTTYYGWFQPLSMWSILSDEFRLGVKFTKHNVFLTCFDQVGDAVKIDGGRSVSPSEFLHKFVDTVGAANNDVTPNIYVCCGEYQSNIVRLDIRHPSINKEYTAEYFNSLSYHTPTNKYDDVN